MPDKAWNPVQEVRAKYPGLKDWSDDRILENLSDPKRFRAAFPQYSGLSDDVIKRNLSGLRSANLPSGVRITGKNVAGRPMYAPEEAAKPTGGAASRFLSSAGQALSGAVSGLYHGAVEGPQNPEEAKVQEKTGRAGLIAKRFLVDPTKQQAQQAVTEYQQARTAPNKYVAREHLQKAAAHALATALPGVGPWAAQVGEQIGTQVGTGDVAGALGTAAGNVGLYAAPHAARGAARLGGAAVRGTAEALTGTGPRGLRKLAESTVKANAEAAVKTAEKNADAARAHMEKTQEALHETAGKEHTYAEKVKAENEQARSKHAAAVAKVREDNARVHARHAADVEQVRKDNARIMAKHQAAADQINQENAATEHALELRRAEETQLQQDTAKYYAKEDAVKAKAKSAADDAWKPWHDKMAGVTVDGAEISEPLNKITAISPEVKRMVRQLTPDPEDAPPESMYAKDRAAIMKSQGYKEDYWDLPPEKRAEVDNIAKSNGFEPEPIDFNPQNGVQIPIEQIHRARSILGKNIYSGRYEGALEGEMKQLYKTLDQAETRASIGADALDDLKSAREATQKYQKAFGRERHAPKTQDEVRKKEANPEQFNEENDRARLSATTEFDPSLAKDFEKVQARREQLKKMQTEDQLRKARKQVPQPPSLDDLREGYRLKPEPAPPSPDDLRPGYRLQAEPEAPAPAEESVAQPERAALPERPEEIQPERKTITPEALAESRRAGVTAAAESLRQQGVRRTINALYYTTPAAVLSTLLGHPGYAFTEVAMAPVILAGSHALAGLIERPEVVNWISKVTPKDVAMFNRLPAEEKAVFTKNLSTLVKSAQKSKLPVSQALMSFVTGSSAAAPAPKTLMQLRKEATQRQQQQLQQQQLQQQQLQQQQQSATPEEETAPENAPGAVQPSSIEPNVNESAEDETTGAIY